MISSMTEIRVSTIFVHPKINVMAIICFLPLRQKFSRNLLDHHVSLVDLGLVTPQAQQTGLKNEDRNSAARHKLEAVKGG